jgi:O-antigen/teichoic acid export membrane protein
VSLPDAIKWSFLSEIASKAVTPLVFVILARLLTPEDYGVAAAATMVISFSQVFWDAGMSKALIQFQGERTAAANAAFWVNCLLGLVVVSILLLSADFVANRVFHDPRVAAVLRVLTLQVLLTAIASVHTALLQKDMKFKPLFWVRLLTVTAPALVSIPVAWQGMGYWALVAGALVGQAVQVLVLWRIIAWRPSLSFDGEVARRLSRFGAWVAVSGLSGWFYLWADSLIVGMHLGAHDLGLYRTGNAFVMMIYGVLFGPLLPVLYSHLSSIQEDRARVSHTLAKVIRTITFVSVPTGFVLYGLAEPIGQIVFGVNWSGVGEVIAILGLTHGFAWIVGANGEAYRAIGRPDCETKMLAGTLPVYLLAYWISIQHGFTVFMWTRFALALCGATVHMWVARAIMGLSVTRTALYILKIAAVGLPLVLLAHSVSALGGELSMQRMLLSAAGVVWVAACLWALEGKSLIPEAWTFARAALRKTGGQG